jgi:hypothetical protein
MPLPGFLCIGAQKAGTSWLFVQLQSHPGVWMPPVKELHFFNHLHVPQNRAWTESHIRQGAARAMRWHLNKQDRADFVYVRYLLDLATRETFTEEWYRRAFDRPLARGRLTGDITPEYSTIPEEGIRHVLALLGAPKIVYMIRDPVDRAISQLRMNVARHCKTPPSEAEWLELAGQWDIANRGDYMTYVPRWKAHVPEADLLFAPYGRIARDPLGLLREIERFLGLAPHDHPGRAERVHATEGPRPPESVRNLLAERLADQTAFVAREFGRDFAALT